MPQNKKLANLVKKRETSLELHIAVLIQQQEEKSSIAVNKLLNQFKEQQKAMDEKSESRKVINREFDDIGIKITQINTNKNPKIQEMKNQEFAGAIERGKREER